MTMSASCRFVLWSPEWCISPGLNRKPLGPIMAVPIGKATLSVTLPPLSLFGETRTCVCWSGLISHSLIGAQVKRQPTKLQTDDEDKGE